MCSAISLKINDLPESIFFKHITTPECVPILRRSFYAYKILFVEPLLWPNTDGFRFKFCFEVFFVGDQNITINHENKTFPI